MKSTAMSELRREGIVEFEDKVLLVNFERKRAEDFEPGDRYLAERNSGPKLLTVKEVHSRSWVVPVEEGAYSFDNVECIGVRVFSKEDEGYLTLLTVDDDDVYTRYLAFNDMEDAMQVVERTSGHLVLVNTKSGDAYAYRGVPSKLIDKAKIKAALKKELA